MMTSQILQFVVDSPKTQKSKYFDNKNFFFIQKISFITFSWQ